MQPRPRLYVPWLVLSGVCVLAMWFSPGGETIPYHLGYAGLAFAFGIDTWSARRAFGALAWFTLATGVILLHRAWTGHLAWGELAEIPLMCLLMGLMVWHVLNRQATLAVVSQRAETDRAQALRRERLVRLTSHEMLTPLTIAVGFVDLVRSRTHDEEVASDLAVVRDELDGLSRSCSRLLRLIRYHEYLPTQGVDIDGMLARMGERWRVVADRDWQVTSSVGVMVCNEDRIMACLDTLVENAVRYTEPGATIRLFGFRENGHVSLGVADAGTGFPEHELLAVNHPGELLPLAPHPVDQRAQTGLGLCLVRDIIESRGGTLRAGRSPEGGALVTLRVPSTVPRTAATAAAAAVPVPVARSVPQHR